MLPRFVRYWKVSGRRANATADLVIMDCEKPTGHHGEVFLGELEGLSGGVPVRHSGCSAGSVDKDVGQAPRRVAGLATMTSFKI